MPAPTPIALEVNRLIRQSLPVGITNGYYRGATNLAHPLEGEYAFDGQDWSLDKAIAIGEAMVDLLLAPQPLPPRMLIKLAREVRRNHYRIDALLSGKPPPRQEFPPNSPRRPLVRLSPLTFPLR